MIALLGLLAVAGYQNRDKIAEVLGGRKQEPGGGPGQNNQQGGLGGVLGSLGGLLSGASAGSVLSGGLGQLVSASGRTARVKRQIPGSGESRQPLGADQLQADRLMCGYAAANRALGEELLSRLTANYHSGRQI
jgi:hypothetical protein